MTIDELLSILNNKMNNLVSQKGNAFLSGDAETVLKIESEIANLQLIIDKLKS
jgi:uncharacterized ferredoxin-like protein